MNWLVGSAMHGHLLDVGSLMYRIIIVNNWVTVWPEVDYEDNRDDEETEVPRAEDVENADETEVAANDQEGE
ncbi:hypothetical protein A1F94_003463 [Pyrenophora tritici-repentis]|nr:hypothetical protein A1F99_041510 [Pyrenophora tritici-repentis]KAG9386713.1 hypothetical protein A1F94_003463 [Pyrenophora tritici-repentis]